MRRGVRNRIELDNWALGTMPYGQTWKDYRRAFHQQMNHNIVARYYPIMVEERDTFLRKLKETPADFPEHIRMSVRVQATFCEQVMLI